jgi:hypothetical protein
MRTNCLVAISVGLASLHFSAVADAQYIFLSGDTNIGNPLNGSGGAPGIDAGNQRFFQNILQGGDTVVVHGDIDGTGSVADVPPAINGFYNSLGGVSSSIFSGVVTNATLAGADLFVVIIPNDAYAAGEVAAMQGFVGGGGTLLFLGENDAFPAQNARINSVLTALGTGMSIVPISFFDPGYHTAVGGQIAADPFTTGVSTFTYAAPSQIALVSGGKNLFFGTAGQPFVAYAVIPEPSAIMLFALGAATLATGGRRHRQRPR